MDSDDLVTPMTGLIVDQEGRLTYMGEDGLRRVIIGDSELFRHFLETKKPKDS